jgi:hypothetical protein
VGGWVGETGMGLGCLDESESPMDQSKAERQSHSNGEQKKRARERAHAKGGWPVVVRGLGNV